MHKLRFLFFTVLLFVAVAFNKELYQVYLYDFEDFSNTSFYASDEETALSMRHDIFETSREYNVELFFIDKIFQGDYCTKINIFASDDLATFLQEEYFLRPGVYQSFFSGSSEITYFPISELMPEIMMRNPEGYYLLGNMDDIYRYKNSFNDCYGGKIPSRKTRDSLKQAKRKLLWAWCAIGVLFALVQYYQLIKDRKTFFVKVSLGESLPWLIFKKAVVENALILLIYIIFSFFANGFSFDYFLYIDNFFFIFLIVVVNVAINIFSLTRNIKVALSQNAASVYVLRIEYIVKTLLLILLFVSVSSGASIINRYLNMKQQLSFYEKYQDYSYVILKEGVDKSVYELETMFYNQYFSKNDISYSGIYAQYGDYASGEYIIGVNANLKEYLLNEMPEIRTQINEASGILLLSKKNRLSQDEIEALRVYSAGFAGCEIDDVSIVFYNNGNCINFFDSIEGYHRKENPIVAFEAKRKSVSNDFATEGIPVFFQKCMINVKEDELVQFCKKNNCKYMVANVYDSFSFQLKKIRRGAVVNLILLAFQILIMAEISISVIYMEFETNRLEILLRKMHGDNLLERMLRILLPSVLSGAISVVSVISFYRIMKMELLILTPLIILGITIADIIINILLYRKTETENIQRTLKGGF